MSGGFAGHGVAYREVEFGSRDVREMVRTIAYGGCHRRFRCVAEVSGNDHFGRTVELRFALAFVESNEYDDQKRIYTL